VTATKIVARSYRCVILASLNVSDEGRFGMEYRRESRPIWSASPPLCWFRCLSPMLGQSPTAG